MGPVLLSICTGIFGIFYILQFEILSLMNWIFFLVWKQIVYFCQFKQDFFFKFFGKGKIFWWTLLNYLFPFYNLQRYILSVFSLMDSLHPLLWIKEIKTFEMTFLTTLTGIWDFAKLISQTGIFSQFKLGKKSNWIFQTGECQNFLKSQCRKIGEMPFFWQKFQLFNRKFHVFVAKNVNTIIENKEKLKVI